MFVVGIDVGKKGACASVDMDGAILELIPMPLDLLSRWFRELAAKEPRMVAVEKAQSMPKQGVSSVFSYATHFGEILGHLRAHQIPFTLVPPRTWTKVLHAGTCMKDDPKDRSLEACRRLFPKAELILPRCRNPHDGMVDALLIAEFCRRTLVKGAAA